MGEKMRRGMGCSEGNTTNDRREHDLVRYRVAQ